MKIEKIVVAILVIIMTGLAIDNIWQAQVIATQRADMKWLMQNCNRGVQ